jgi:hypothetical protein
VWGDVDVEDTCNGIPHCTKKHTACFFVSLFYSKFLRRIPPHQLSKKGHFFGVVTLDNNKKKEERKGKREKRRNGR